MRCMEEGEELNFPALPRGNTQCGGKYSDKQELLLVIKIS